MCTCENKIGVMTSPASPVGLSYRVTEPPQRGKSQMKIAELSMAEHFFSQMGLV